MSDEWYYIAANGEQVGPKRAASLRVLRLPPTTLVWNAVRTGTQWIEIHTAVSSSFAVVRRSQPSSSRAYLRLHGSSRVGVRPAWLLQDLGREEPERCCSLLPPGARANAQGSRVASNYANFAALPDSRNRLTDQPPNLSRARSNAQPLWQPS